jgi:hypothetical protein
LQIPHEDRTIHPVLYLHAWSAHVLSLGSRHHQTEWRCPERPRLAQWMAAMMLPEAPIAGLPIFVPFPPAAANVLAFLKMSVLAWYAADAVGCDIAEAGYRPEQGN